MLKNVYSCFFYVMVMGALLSNTAICRAANPVQLFSVPDSVTDSGQQVLDYVLFNDAVTENAAATFDGDDANSNMPKGGNSTANESFITSFGELRDFYRLNFPDGTGGSSVDELLIFVNISESGSPKQIQLDLLNIIIDYDLFTPAGDTRNDPLANDVSSASQNSTQADFTGGTLLATLGSSATLTQRTTPGRPDYVAFTGIDPFDAAYSDSTRVLIHWGSSGHTNGSEIVHLSGRFGSDDLAAVPEPATATMLVFSSMLLLHRRRRCA